MIPVTPAALQAEVNRYAREAATALEELGYKPAVVPRAVIVSGRRGQRLNATSGKWGVRIRASNGQRIYAAAWHQWNKRTRTSRITMVLPPDPATHQYDAGDLRHEVCHGVMHASAIPAKLQHGVMEILHGSPWI